MRLYQTRPLFPIFSLLNIDSNDFYFLSSSAPTRAFSHLVIYDPLFLRIVIFGQFLALSSLGLTRRSREERSPCNSAGPCILDYALRLPAHCLRGRLPALSSAPLPRDCANKKLPVASFYASPFTLLKTRTTLCPPFEMKWN